MTFREKNYPAPTILTSPEYEADVISSINTRIGNYSSARYGHQTVRDTLKLIYGRNCAYCESKIEPSSPINIDHFRPINTYATNVNPQHHTGYYWLGYEWTNLIQACGTCNGIKSSKFHLQNNANRQPNAPPLIAGRPNYALHKIDSVHYANEDPLLINPERVNPDSHLYVDYFGLLRTINGSVYGNNTINICELNRDGLYVERAELINKYISDIENEIFERYREDGLALSEQQYQHRLNLIFQRIIAQQHIDLQYNMTARCIVERFEELILEDIERVFRVSIRNYFIAFLKTL